MKILRVTDRVKLTVGGVTFYIAPLTKDQKTEATQCTMTTAGGNTTLDLLGAQCIYLKYGLKKIEGVKDSSGKDYQLSFDGDCLSDDSLTELMTLPIMDSVYNYFWQSLNGMPDELKDPSTGKKLKGVKLDIVSGETLIT
jgi:hypothetical protein